MGIATALASYLSVPITQATSWKGLILCLSLVCLLTLLVWFPNHGHNHFLEGHEKKQEKENILKSKQVWAIIVFGGLQSLLFYTCMTWLPTMAISAGLSHTDAGLLASIFSLISIPFSMTIPSLTTRLSNHHRQNHVNSHLSGWYVRNRHAFIPKQQFLILVGGATLDRDSLQRPFPLPHGLFLHQNKLA